MNSRSWISLAGTALVALVTAGCGEDGNSTTTSTPPPPPAASAPAAETGAAPSASAQAAAAVEVVKENAQDAAKAVQQVAGEAGAAVQEKVNAVVGDVKKLIADGKGSEALQKLQSAVSGLKLTPEQQKSIDDLKAQIAKLVSKENVDAAKKAVTDALTPKR